MTPVPYYERDHDMRDLMDCKILGVYVAPDQSKLAFRTSKGWRMYDTEGDCCSETWFSDIYNFDALKDGTIVSIEEVPTETIHDDPRSRQDVDDVYGFKLRTEKGIATIVFRNSSNGYYGGNLEYAGDDAAPSDFVEITDDWRA